MGPMAKTWLKATLSNMMRHGMSAKVSPWQRTSLVGPVDQVVAAREAAKVAEATVVAEVMVGVAAIMVEEARASKAAKARIQEALVEEVMVTTTVEEARVSEAARAKVGIDFVRLQTTLPTSWQRADASMISHMFGMI